MASSRDRDVVARLVARRVDGRLPRFVPSGWLHHPRVRRTLADAYRRSRRLRPRRRTR
jgi:hypothetical protein